MNAERSSISPTRPDERRGTPQERFEYTVWGRRLISVFIIAILIAILITNLPPSRIAQSTTKRLAPLMDRVGLAQGWYLFAPDPTPETVRLVAVISLADGTRKTWTPLRLGPWIGPYRDIHWRGYDSAAQAQAGGVIWQELARWLADRYHQADGPGVEEISFYRGVARSPRPGSKAKPTWRIEKLHTFYPLIG